ncbi:acyl-CoA dehydrogenase family protein [Primorskyibacter sp. S87]|uniref:acyl-CoA dehydrogenase family protein n=1 Tax=Primorskyibacter sp. S87 TaxID=3415126 RepID=UPI003C7D6075
MNFELTEERQMLQDGLRRFLRETYTPSLRAELAEADFGFSRDVWNGLAEMGVIGALFSEDDGGFAGGGFDISLVFEELGRVGAVDPLLDTAILGGGLIAALGNEDQKQLMEAVIAGSTQLAFAHAEPSSRYDMSLVETTATRDGDGYVLNGRKAVVVNAPAADHVLISARTAGADADRNGISLFLVPAGIDGMTLRSYPLVSGGQAAEILLEDVRLGAGARLGPEGGAYDAIAEFNARATLAICAEALGLMESIRELTTDYLKTRKQFGKSIGKFQALQHRMADVLIEIEQARSAVINLAGHLDSAAETRDTHVSATKNLIGNAAKLVAEESIQMHGGIGMTEEYELGHLAKRLIMVDHRFGDAIYHLERFVALAVA